MQTASNLNRTGPIADALSQLLTMETLAAHLSRSPVGLRNAMYADTSFGRSLRQARVKLGRRIYFRRDLIDQLIEESTGN